MSDTYTEAPSQVVNKPVLMADDTIARLNSEGSSTNYEPLQTINKSKDAMGGLQTGQVGIVIGSGDNTESWKQKGWRTCDVDPKFNSDYTIDANDLQSAIGDGYLPTERIVVANPKTKESFEIKVNPEGLLTAIKYCDNCWLVQGQKSDYLYFFDKDKKYNQLIALAD